MKIDLTLLKNCPQHIQHLASWIFETWGHYNPGLSIEKVQLKLQSYLNEQSLPLCYVALNGTEPIGMCCLRENDGIRSDLTPWLGSLFVKPSHRGQGIGERLINVIVNKTNDLGYRKLYLLAFDPTLPNWYQKLGWKMMGVDRLNGLLVSVMEININHEN